MIRAIQAVAGAAIVAGAVTTGTAPASAATETCELTVSDGAEILVCASVNSAGAAPGNVYANGRAIEMHEYLRVVRVVTTLERKNAAGQWEVVARAESWDREGISVSTAEHPAAGVLRACATGGIAGHEMTTVCTA